MKTNKIIAWLVVTVLVLGGGYYLYKGTGAPAPTAEAPSVLAPVNGTTVSDKIPETNPFQTNVNPYDSYKNPFAQ